MRRVGPEGRARPGASKVDVEIPACVEFGTRAPSDDRLPFNFARRIALANCARLPDSLAPRQLIRLSINPIISRPFGTNPQSPLTFRTVSILEIIL